MSKTHNTLDWNSILSQDSLRKAGNKAAQQTNAELSGKIATLTNLTKKDIENTFPTKRNKVNLIELMKIVNSATTRQNKINSILNKSEEFGTIILSLLRKFT